MTFTPHAMLTLSNSHALLISVNDTGEEITYKYSNDEEISGTSEILFDSDGEPYFTTDNDCTFRLSEFIKIF